MSFQAIYRRMLENFTVSRSTVRFNTEASRLREQGDAVVLRAGGETLSTGFLLTCAGLQSDRLARVGCRNWDLRGFAAFVQQKLQL